MNLLSVPHRFEHGDPTIFEASIGLRIVFCVVQNNLVVIDSHLIVVVRKIFNRQAPVNGMSRNLLWG